MTTDKKNSFIGTLAWLTIVLAGFMLFIGLAQSAMFYFMFSPGGFSEALMMPPNSPPLPSWASYLFKNFHWFIGGFTLFSAVLLVAGIGLLKRKEWARVTVQVILILKIIVMLAGTWMQDSVMSSFPIPNPAPAELTQVMMATKVFSWILTLFFCGFSVWLYVKLQSKIVRAEFLAEVKTMTDTPSP